LAYRGIVCECPCHDTCLAGHTANRSGRPRNNGDHGLVFPGGKCNKSAGAPPLPDHDAVAPELVVENAQNLLLNLRAKGYRSEIAAPQQLQASHQTQSRKSTSRNRPPLSLQAATLRFCLLCADLVNKTPHIFGCMSVVIASAPDLVKLSDNLAQLLGAVGAGTPLETTHSSSGFPAPPIAQPGWRGLKEN
jgi:hypothetical protein